MKACPLPICESIGLWKSWRGCPCEAHNRATEEYILLRWIIFDIGALENDLQCDRLSELYAIIVPIGGYKRDPRLYTAVSEIRDFPTNAPIAMS